MRHVLARLVLNLLCRSTATAQLTPCRLPGGISLHDVVLPVLYVSVFISILINHRNLASEIIEGWWRRHGPFQSRGLPGVLSCLRSLVHAPEKIEEEDELGRAGDERRDGHECVHWHEVLHTVFDKTRVAARHAFKANKVHRQEDAVDADKGDPEMDMAQRFVQHAAKHLRVPEVSTGEHAEDRRHSHDHVEMPHYEVVSVEKDVERRLRQEHTTQASGHKHRDEAQGKHHGSGEA